MCQNFNETILINASCIESHVLEQHFRHLGLEFLDKLTKEILCPHCCEILPDKCKLLKHIYQHHPQWSGAAMVALKERSHFYEWGLAGSN